MSGFVAPLRATSTSTVPDRPPYRLLICDLRTDQLLERITAQGVGFDDYIGKPGSISGTIPVPDEATARRVKESLMPGRTITYVERGRDIWAGYLCWTRTPTCDQRGRISVPFQGASLDSYFDHRLLMDTQISEQVDQLDIVRGLLDYAQAKAGGDLGIVYQPTVSGVLRDRTYSRYDLPSVYELIDQLSKVEDGFEWRIRCYREASGARVRELQLGYPRIEIGATDIMLDKPGKILAYALPEDATERATHWQSRGASINQNQAIESVPLTSAEYYILQDGVPAVDQGWPRLDGTSDYSTVEVQDTLEAHARADLLRAWDQHTIPKITVVLDGSVTPALLGSRVRIRIRDVWHYDGFDQRYRVVGMKVSPPERGQSETADLFLEAI